MVMIHEFVNWMKEQTDDVELKGWLNDRFDDFKNKKIGHTTNYRIKCKKCGNILFEGHNY